MFFFILHETGRPERPGMREWSDQVFSDQILMWVTQETQDYMAKGLFILHPYDTRGYKNLYINWFTIRKDII